MSTVMTVVDQMLMIVPHVLMDCISSKESVELLAVMDITKMTISMNVQYVTPTVKLAVLELVLIVSHVISHMVYTYTEPNVSSNVPMELTHLLTESANLVTQNV